MTSSSDYTPPKIWTWTKLSGGTFASINMHNANVLFQ